MSNKEQEVPKFTVEQLVAIGDAVHDSNTAIIIADNIGEKEHNVTVCVKGRKKDLMAMLYNVLKTNEHLEDVMADAVMMVKLEKIADGLKNMGSNNEM